MSNGVLSQEEIDALLKSASTASTEEPVIDELVVEGSQETAPVKEPAAPSVLLTPMQIDALGEVSNISMGSAATALSTLLNHRVDITTPQVEVTTYAKLQSQYPLPFVVINVKYTMGLEGSSLLVIRYADASIIADLMMGNDGTNPPPELNDLHISAIGEAMNQMMGSSCTAISAVLKSRIDIASPKVKTVNLASEPLCETEEEQNQDIIKVGFKMDIADLVVSEIMQVFHLDFAREMVSNLIRQVNGGNVATETVSAPQDTIIDIPLDIPEVTPVVQESLEGISFANTATPVTGQMQGVDAFMAGNQKPGNQGSVTVQPAQFAQLNNQSGSTEQGNINLIMDVPLQVTVELGKTRKTIREILALAPGAVVELDKLAGEPVDLLVNGKLLAKGEVVVIDENFGIRITDIVSPMERVTNLQ
ncbi:MAG: flagellar motor switch phosphatase FliY [Thermincolia bacterium]